MNKTARSAALVIGLLALFAVPVVANKSRVKKPSPDEVITMLKEGNQRFVSGKPIHPHTDATRLALAGTQGQGNHAYASVLTCSNSRVPVELLFDAGVMDIFVIQVAGSVVGVDEVGSIEYGLEHVRAPVLVVLGHPQCGAVTTVTNAIRAAGATLKKPAATGGRAYFWMAEREGFEPSVELSPHTRLAGERLQPARPSLLGGLWRRE